MKIHQLINDFHALGEWVNWDETKDHLLFGNPNDTIIRIGVCWVATIEVINRAIENNINLIICHENLFYNSSTSPKSIVIKSIEEKQKLLRENNISVYRCHDLLDRFPEFGVADKWAELLGFNFEPRDISSFNSYANIEETTVSNIASSLVSKLKSYGQNGVHVLGDINKLIRKLGIGTGALTDVFTMAKNDVDLCIVSDDGINNWYPVQWALDNNIPLIIVNHAISEIPGIISMTKYLSDTYKSIDTIYLGDSYSVHYFT